jgi:hypothetical protein|tara:strand:+ start:382 stop:498 length:117 start_codon:yes stop_codon:yes gene_type:complete
MSKSAIGVTGHNIDITLRLNIITPGKLLEIHAMLIPWD